MKSLVQKIYSPPKKKHSVTLSSLYSNHNRSVRYYSLARHALKQGLLSLNLKPGSRILIPSFLCRDVLASLNEVGLSIVFYDVDESLSLNSKIDELPKAEAILVVHYFGFETDLTNFKRYCDLNKAFLIEDNAHGLFSKNSVGNFLGTDGDLGIISIRKTFPIENGAMLICPKERAAPLTPIHNFSSKNLVIKNLLRPFVATFGVGFLLTLTAFKRKLRKLKTGHELPQETDEDELKIPFAPNPIDIDQKLSEYDFEAEIKRRRGLFYYVRDLLLPLKVVPIRNELSEGEVPYTFAFLCQNEDYSIVQKKLEKAGLEVVRWPSLPKEVDANPKTPDFYRNMYLVKFLW